MRKKSNLTKTQKDIVRKTRKLSIALFFGTLGIFSILGILLPARPKVSEAEKRTLAKFPGISWTSFWNGDYFSKISLWYSDTYPMRDSLINADHNLKSLFGFEPSVQMIGGNTQADEIPTVTEVTTEDTVALNTTEATTETQKPEPVLPDSKAMEAEIQNQIQNGVYIDKGAAYSVYYFTQSAADRYIQALEGIANDLEGQTNVYSILVPNQSGVLLPQETQDKIGGSNQKQAIDYYYNSYNKVKSVNTIDTLREHTDEYLYFRTDHHWTQLAAYYVYQNFCKVKGIQSHDLSSFTTTKTFQPFLGTFYSSFKNSDMAANPDYVLAYYPNDTNDLTFWDVDGTKYDWHVITDVEGWSNDSMYACYIGGDKPLAIVENPKINDGSSCLVLKESYGNAFVPFLVDHYQTVYVIDFRYAQTNVRSFIQEHNVKDLIVINNITIIGSDDVSSTIAGLLQ